MSKTNTKKPRKPTHRFVDNSIVSKVSVVPLPSTRAMFDPKRYGLPAIFEVEINGSKREYIESLRDARGFARTKQLEVDRAVSGDLGGSVSNETHILEKVKRSSKKINRF